MRTPPAIAATLSDFVARCVQLEHENQELRETVWRLLVGEAQRRELREFVRAELERRWP